MGWLLGGLGSALFLILLVGVVGIWRRNRYWDRLLRSRRCPVCDADFAEEIVQIVGRVGPAERAHLDHFQQRFAVFSATCSACGAHFCCTEDGTPMGGWFDD